MVSRRWFSSGRARGFILLALAGVMGIVGLFAGDSLGGGQEELTGVVESVANGEIELGIDGELTVVVSDGETIVRLPDGGRVGFDDIVVGSEVHVIGSLDESERLRAEEIRIMSSNQ